MCDGGVIELPGPWTVKEEVFTCRETKNHSMSGVVIGLRSKLINIRNSKWADLVFH